MTRWIRRGNGDGVLGSDSSRFLKDAVPNLSILSYIGDFKVDTTLWLLAHMNVRGVRPLTQLPPGHL